MTKKSLIGFSMDPGAVPVREGDFKKIDQLIIQVKALEKLLMNLLGMKKVRLCNLMDNGNILGIILGKHAFIFLKPFFEGYPDFDNFDNDERDEIFNNLKAELMEEIRSLLSKHSTCINREYAMAQNISNLLGIDRRFYRTVLKRDSSLKEFVKKGRTQRGPKGFSFKINSVDKFFIDANF